MGNMSRNILAALFAAFTLALSACAGNSDYPGSSLLTGPPVADGQLPSIPGLAGVREPSVATQVALDPTQFLFSAGQVNVQGEDLLLDTDAGTASWAMFGYQAGENPLISLRLTFSFPNGPGAWVALANYQTGRWDWQPKAVLTQQTYQVSSNQNRNYVSPQGNLYFAVLSADGADVLITDMLVVVDLPPPPTFSISGSVKDENQTGIAGILIGLSVGGQQTTTDGSGNYSFSGLEAGSYTVTPTDANFDFNPVSLNANVVSKDIADLNFVASPVQQTVTYVADIAPLINGSTGEKSCLDCHSGQFPEAGLDFSTYQVVKDNAANINIQVNKSSGWMPKNGAKWSQANRDLFQAWIDGGRLEQ